MQFPFFEIDLFEDQGYAVLYLNRPEKRNAMGWPFWRDLPRVVEHLATLKKIRVVLVAGAGKSFTTGLDLEEFFEQFKDVVHGQNGEEREQLADLIRTMQAGFRRIMESPQVYISCVHKHCIGGGLDLISACDIRLASKDASVSLRETKVAIVADMGSLNRLPFIIGDGNTRLMAFTGRDFSAEECRSMGLFSQVYDSQEKMMEEAKKLAAEIAANPSIILRGVKQNLNYQNGKSTLDGMDYVITYNSAFLDTKALREMMAAFKERRRPTFE